MVFFLAKKGFIDIIILRALHQAQGIIKWQNKREEIF